MRIDSQVARWLTESAQLWEGFAVYRQSGIWNVTSSSRARMTVSVLVMFLSFPVAAWEVEPDDCPTVQHCIWRLHEVANDNLGLSPKQRAVIYRLAEFGEQAVYPLIVLLEDPEDGTAKLAGSALASIEHIDPVFLPAIIAGLDRGLTGLPPALSRIGTSEAAQEAVTRYLASPSSPGNQEAFAIRLLGEKAIPYLIAAARCNAGDCENLRYHLIGHALDSMSVDHSDTARDLFDIAQHAHEPSVRRGALVVLSMLGEDGLIVEDDLIDLRFYRPELSEQIGRVLIGIRSRYAGDEFTRILSEAPDDSYPVVPLRDLAEVGSVASSAGPAVLQFLESTDATTRVAAARTLGFIEYYDAIDHLFVLLLEARDVRMNWVAAESLGRLRADTAIDLLEETARSHWYPPVQEAAERAIANISNGSEYSEDANSDHFPSLFFEYQNMRSQIEPCRNVPMRHIRQHSGKRIRPHNERALFELFQPEEPPQPGFRAPDFALRVTDGWLVGTNRGEWGGELTHVDEVGRKSIVLEANITDLHKFEDDLVAVTGLAHLSMNEGALYRVSQDPNGEWQASLWRHLPGAPRSSRTVDTGELLVNSLRGSILVDQEGSMRMAPCDDKD